MVCTEDKEKSQAMVVSQGALCSGDFSGRDHYSALCRVPGKLHCRHELLAELSRLLPRTKSWSSLSSPSSTGSLEAAKGMQSGAVLVGRGYACSYIVTTERHMSLWQAVLSFQQENM